MDGGVLLRQVSSGCVGAHAVRLLRHPFAMGYCRDGYAHGDDPGMGTPLAWGHLRHVSDAAGSGDWAPPGCAGLKPESRWFGQVAAGHLREQKKMSLGRLWLCFSPLGVMPVPQPGFAGVVF